MGLFAGLAEAATLQLPPRLKLSFDNLKFDFDWMNLKMVENQGKYRQSESRFSVSDTPLVTFLSHLKIRFWGRKRKRETGKKNCFGKRTGSRFLNKFLGKEN